MNPPVTASPPPASASPASVCIVTHEFSGIPGSGGIGTAFTGLAETLAAAGHAVTVLCSGLLPLPPGFEEAPTPPGVTRVRLPSGPVPLEADPFLRLSHEAFLWLSERRFDIVHFADWTGLGFCATSAKRQGLAFAGTTLVVGLHGPTRWVRSATGGGLEGPEELAIDFLERRSAEQADVVVSPSRYLLDWVRESGWALPPRAEVRQNVLPKPRESAPAAAGAVKEVVFFGRLEERKGVVLFCDALDHLAREAAPEDLRITFLGGSAPVAGEDGIAYVHRRAAAWPWPVDGRHDLPSHEALAYLAGEGRLAVIPSRIENSPCTVAECLIRGLPFLASRVGGTAELVADADAGRVLFDPDADALAARLADALRNGAFPARLRIPQEPLAAEWLDWHRAAASLAGDPEPAAPAGDTHALLAAPGFRLAAGGAERMAGVAARTGAAVVGCMVERATPPVRRFWPGGPAALSLFRDVLGPGPLLVRRDLLDGAPAPEDRAGRRAWLSRLALAGHAIEMIPLPLAVSEDADGTGAAGLAPFLETGVPAPMADLARVALGLDVRTGRLAAERDRLAGALARLAEDNRKLAAERNRLAVELENAVADGTRAQELWRARLVGLLDSQSWRLTAPLRRRFGGVEDSRLAALPPDRAADTVTSSVWWDLAAAWRLAARIKHRLFRR